MIDDTPTREGRCVYCGTSRPATKPVCPECGRTWIDTKIGEDIPALTPATVAASKGNRKTAGPAAVDLAPPPEDTSRRPWGLLVGALIGLGIVWVLASSVFGNNGDDAATVTTRGVTTTTDVTTGTTDPTTTTEQTTTTAATTTTTSTTTTTTTTTLAPIEAEGVAIPIEDLTLGAFALGPFSFDAGTSYLGRLVATLGQPDTKGVAGTDVGLCPDDDGITYTWGGFSAIFRIDDGTEVLAGYRLARTDADDLSQSIRSRSGLKVGDTIEKLDAIYLQSGLTFEEIDGIPHFLLLRSSDDATLLWGPVTTTDASGIVEGIYSPRACDRGPVATP